MVDGVPPQTYDLPHLVLYRNGHLTPAVERTLIVEVTGIVPPTTGVTVTLEIQTQHGDPDARDGVGQRMSVWQASQWVPKPERLHRTGTTARFAYEFGAAAHFGAGTIATPTDYFRYEVTVTDTDHPRADPLYAIGKDHAFLMENQWLARLPEVREPSPDAAPDELVVYYCDMFPFGRDADDPSSWLPRKKITDYVGAELLPQMVEAFRVQANEWGFPWYHAWTSRRVEDGRRLGVALCDGETWFHGRTPLRGNEEMSLNVSGGMPEYETLTSGLVSVFYHELFHNHQRNISLHRGEDGQVNGWESAWAFFTEGTAVLASSVGQPHVQFAPAQQVRDYLSFANQFVRSGEGRFQDLITDYADLGPYSAALYWRFLYEQCGGMREGKQDPAAGMAIVRRALTVLYSDETVHVDASTDVLAALPKVLDRALAGSSCPFQTYEQSLVAFARALYGLRVAEGRCVRPGLPAGCGFYDPHGVYGDPPAEVVTFDGATGETHRGMMKGFDVRLIEVILARSAEGKPLTLEFHAPSADGARFDVQIVHMTGSEKLARPRPILALHVPTEACESRPQEGSLICVIPEIRVAAYNRLGLIVTRLDGGAEADVAAEATLTLRPGI